MSKAAILVVEDDPDIRELLSFALSKEGWAVLEAADGEAALSLLGSSNCDCIVLDIMLPGVDGLEFLRRVKSDAALARIPVILASARGEEVDVVAGLELGADDYVVKPYSPRVLVARIRAALRRVNAAREQVEGGAASGSQAAVLEVGGLRLDPERHELLAEGSRVELSATEFAILRVLMAAPGRVFSRGQIIDATKGHDYPVTDRAVDVQVLSLRRKLGAHAELIETVRGVGYRFKD